jgi:transposase
MKAYSTDLRMRIVQAVEGGMSLSEAARVYRVGRSTVKRYVVQLRNEGDLAPKVIPGRRPTIGPEQLDALRAQVREWPDASLAEHVRLWARRQHTLVSVSTMSRALRSVGWTRPKRH